MWSLAGSERDDLANASERSLIAAAQGGSEPAAEALFRRHWPQAHRAAFLIVRDAGVAEDIVQEAFLAAFAALDRFDRRRPFAPWLHRIAVNRAIDWTRARRLRREVAVSEGVLESLRAAPDAEPTAEGEAGALLAGLSPDHRAVVVLRYLLDYTPGEIAKMLDLPRGTVNSRLRRALDRLGEELEGGAR